MSATTARLLGMLAVLLSVACADAEPDVPMGQGLAVFEAPVTMNVCADGATVFGIDVSKWQGSIDWAAVRGAGVRYAFIRVSNGTDIIDEYFEQNWAGAGAQGILRGVYQYFRPNQDAAAQADLLLRKLATSGGGELPPVIDVEAVDGQPPTTISARVGEWIGRVEGALGVKPIIYTGSYFWDENVQTSAFSSYPLWGAHWGVTCPTISSAWPGWTFHQYSESGTVAGVTGAVDLDRFNGTMAQLRALGADPACTANPAHVTCTGDVRVSCDGSRHLVEAACPTGQTCTTAGGLRCISAACSASPDGQACIDGTRLRGCSNEVHSEVDCGIDGGICSDAGGNGHCVAFACRTQLAGAEDGTFCLDQENLATCAMGAYAESACASGKRCSDVGGTGHCVDTECWAPWDDDADRVFCADAVTLGSCAGGVFTTTTCGQHRRCDAQQAACVGQGMTPVDEEPRPDVATDTWDPGLADAHGDDSAMAPDAETSSHDSLSGQGTGGAVAGRPRVNVEARQYPTDAGCGSASGSPDLDVLGFVLWLSTAVVLWRRRSRGLEMTG